MLLKFRELLAIKFLLILFFFCCSLNVFSQSKQDTTLRKQSAELLDRNISIQWPGGPLPELLKELSVKESLNISYSREKTKHINVKNQNVNSENLSFLLNKILYNTGCTYIVIGKTIAIVEDIKQQKDQPAEVEDSVSTPSIPERTENAQKIISHIYPDSTLNTRLPYHIRKELRKIYRYELSLARKHKNDSTETENPSDTLRNHKQRKSRYIDPTMFVSANSGLSLFRVRHISDYPDWKNFLDFKFKSSSSLFFEINGGIVLKNVIVETGFRYYRMKFENTYVENSKTVKVVDFSEVYTVITLPVNLLYYKKSNNFLFGSGPGIGLSFIERSAPKNKMKPYYDRINGPGPGKEKYLESNKKIAMGLNLKAFTGYEISTQWIVSASILLNLPISPYHTNSVYRMYPINISAQLGISYFF